ncbi:RES family NAD+ phosphorylase [Phenylobacterium sp.]|uniref:RES family NAD+ phosphorylase n=1 Tax=Phenylobacterium sp. TaxID=1871053 RepID=UPI0025FE3E19|nr:RES family NAD+ phosphorylase [Phenylobacterium sp.]MBX3482405.1 RES family NAD+ phosphorylase [Phenylobacterium sp.]MCW5758199.1 RES family NAD+ phosphorylase [Phenylobacterium sp.]
MADPLYEDFDPEVDFTRMTLCEACAKHDSLKRFVAKHAVLGPVCGICQRVDTPYGACDVGQKFQLTNLVKALVRFFYHEYEYNHHWGGDHQPEALLATANPILEDTHGPGFERSPGKSADFLYDLFSAEPYPPVDKGVSVYAGFGPNGERHLAFAISDSPSWMLRDLSERLASENPFDVEPEVDAIIERIGTRIDKRVVVGSSFYRCRIGTAKRWERHTWDWKPNIRHQPYQAGELGAPPPPSANSGRLNREGVAFLYLASDQHTAAAEVRPHPGHLLSVGQYRAARDVRIAAFEADIAEFCGSEADLNLFHFIHAVDQTMARPVLPGATGRYTVTQLVADCLRRRGFDGVSFQSSVANGQNLCVFRPDTFAYVEDSAAVLSVKALAYTLEDAPMLLAPEDGDYDLES